MMQDPSPPVGLLRRAGNLLNSNGQAVKAPAYDPPLIRRNGLGGSFRRKLQHFKDHSKLLGCSLNTSPSSSSITVGHLPHSKSMSDLGTIHAPIHTNSEPISTSKRHSAQVPINTLLNLSDISVQNAVEALEPVSTSPAVGDIRVPLLLQQGTPMTKVSLKRHKKFVFRLDADLGQIVWESNRHKIS